jgi:hypothetical protein
MAQMYFEVDANRGYVVVDERAVSVAQQQARFARSAVLQIITIGSVSNN